ncbi:hypothetical protein GJAV_G00028920 [Gymnothorax javanicus]|nr:hypothetical protein GJAV_G00028920 [Gymnothorax javanicus]
MRSRPNITGGKESRGRGEEESLSSSQEENGLTQGELKDFKAFDPAAQTEELLKGETHEATGGATQEPFTYSGINMMDTESPALTESMKNQSLCTDGQSRQEHQPLECHGQWTESAGPESTGGTGTTATLTSVCSVATNQGAGGDLEMLDVVGINEVCSCPIRSLLRLTQDTVCSKMEGREGKEVASYLTGHKEGINEQVEDEKKGEAIENQNNLNSVQRQHTWMKPLPARREDAEWIELKQSAKEPNHLELYEQTEHKMPLSCMVKSAQREEPSQQQILVVMEQIEEKQTYKIEKSDWTEQPEYSEVQQQPMQREQPKQTEQPAQMAHLNQMEQAEQQVWKKQLEQMEQPEQIKNPEEVEQPKQTKNLEQLEQPEQIKNEEPLQQPEQIKNLEQLEKPEQIENLWLCEHAELCQQPQHMKCPEQSEQMKCIELAEKSNILYKSGLQNTEHVKKIVKPLQPQQTEDRRSFHHTNGECLDREKAQRLAEELYKLQDVRRTDVVKYLNKDTEFSHAVGEEYLKFFDFSGQNLNQGLRSFLKVVVLIGESQERERVLEHFSHRYHQCNPDSFSSQSSVFTLTCALMLLNTDLHGRNPGKAMSISTFVSNLGGMNDGKNFCKDLLKDSYNAIKNEPLEWAVGEEELKRSMLLPRDEKTDSLLHSRSNPFQDVPHNNKAMVYKQGFLTRKAHADIDGKRIPWGKRSWKTFYAVLKGLVLYLQKDEYKIEWQNSAEVISVHHALAERADDYTKKPYVFRLLTADWRIFLFQASTLEQMSSWINRINLVSALYSSPPFPAAVGSQKRFSRPILPAMQSALTLEQQLQSHSRTLESFSNDLVLLQQTLSEGRKAKARELQECREREEYLLREKCRYEVYKQMLEEWKGLCGYVDGAMVAAELERFDKKLYMATEEEEAGLKKSHSSPSINLEVAPPPIVKVRRNISERRTYRKIVIPRRNREL